MKNDNDASMMNNIKNELNYTGIGDKPSKGKEFLLIDLYEMAEETEKKNFLTNYQVTLEVKVSKIFYHLT